MMVKGRVHDLVSQCPGQRRRVQGFNKIRVIEKRHSICGHRLNRPGLAPLQPEQERAEKGMVQDEMKCVPSEYAVRLASHVSLQA